MNSMYLCYLKNQKGFSIASVVVAMGIASVLILGISTALQHTIGSVTYIEDKQSAMDLKNEITIDLSDSTACLNSLTGIRVVAGDLSVSNLRNSANQVQYQSRVYDGLRIGNIFLENVSLPLTPNQNGRMNLMVNVSRNRSRGQQDLKSIKVPLSVTTDASNRIINCVALGSSELDDEARKCSLAQSNSPYKIFRGASRPSSVCANTGCEVVKRNEGFIYKWREGHASDNNGAGFTHHRAVCINKNWVEL